MEKQGMVSLWVGKTDRVEKMHEYMERRYTEDGDSMPSDFMKDFNIDYYDEDFQEMDCFEKSVDKLEEALKGCSYDDKVIPRFLELCGEALSEEVNAMLLIYNFEYDGSVVERRNAGIELKYLGSVIYE